MQDSTTGWVTFQKIPLHDGRVIVVQKKDGESRTVIQRRPAGTRIGGHGEMATNGHINPTRAKRIV